jgi:hypothetical protein
MNVELAMRALRVAKANPEQFDMSDWVTGLYDDVAVKEDLEFVPPCGTTACFAGWVSFLGAPVGSEVFGQRVYLPGRGDKGIHVGDYAEEVLEITTGQGLGLFYLDNIDQVGRAVRYLADNPDASMSSIRAAAGQHG